MGDRRRPVLIIGALLWGAWGGLAAPAGGGVPPQVAEVGPRLAAVDSLLRHGRPTEALADLDRLAGGFGEDPLYGWQIAERRGVALLDLGQTADALPLLEETVARRPLAAGAHRNLALALARLGRRGRALSEYAQVVELAPDDPVGRLEHAHYLAGFGQWAAAAEEYRVAAHLCGGCPDAERGLGHALLQQGRAEAAVGPLQRAQAAAPDTSGRRLLVAALHAAHRDSALLALLDGEDRARWDRRDHLAAVEAEGWLGGAPVRSRAYAAALAAGSVAAAVRDDALFWGRVALNLLKGGDYEAGLAAADRAVALAPDNPVFRNNRVVLLLKLGRQDEAAAEWRRVVALDPSLDQQAPPPR